MAISKFTKKILKNNFILGLYKQCLWFYIMCLIILFIFTIANSLSLSLWKYLLSLFWPSSFSLLFRIVKLPPFQKLFLMILMPCVWMALKEHTMCEKELKRINLCYTLRGEDGVGWPILMLLFRVVIKEAKPTLGVHRNILTM